MRDYTNSEMNHIIDEHIHSARDRLILKLCFIDGYTREKIAEHKDVQLTPRRVSTIISNGALVISKYLD